MIDQAEIKVLSGKGGNGCISGRREKFVPHGGPDGGDGGDGGSITLVGNSSLSTLRDLRYQSVFKAAHGGAGRGALKHGRNGGDLEINVPVGTEAWIGGRPSDFLADLRSDGQRVLVAKGGHGGRGNAWFTSPTNQFPLLAEEGEAGETVDLRLELKLLADVGIIGAPNAGKSTLLSAVSGARPKIADYPFTTLEPVLGVVEWRDASFVMVDIPGLIEGAHEGIGLGHEFLRHVERTRVLVHMVDASSEDPLSFHRQINEELRLFNVDLSEKRQIVALNKTDVAGVTERLDGLDADGTTWAEEVHRVSVVARDGVGPLLDAVVRVLSEEPAPTADLGDESELVVIRPAQRRETMRVRVEGSTFVVSAPRAARVAAMVNTRDWNARAQLYGYLKRVGVSKALEDAGVASGDMVRIGRVEWEWD